MRNILDSMKYKNPILTCDYSDPDVIRVGDTFYMTASSFNFTPGLPVLASKNLVDWKLINYACHKIPYEWYDKPQNAKGIWAPAIRYHDGKFYIFVGMPDEGIFFTQTEDPKGEWSELQCVWAGKGFEDPCPIWNNGKLFVVHGYVKSRIGFNSKLGLFELNPQTFEAVSEDKIIFDGTKTQPTIEGPKFYKKNEFFYIFAPAGGVSAGWQTVLRSKKIDGDYEEKIVLVQGDSPVNGPHQGGWVETPQANSCGIKDWFVHFQERGVYGRIVHLQPMKWKDGWPMMGTSVETENYPGNPYLEFENPAALSGNLNEEFKIENKFLDFQFSANPKKEYAEFSNEEIKLFAIPVKTTIWKSSNVLTKKVDADNFDFECEFNFSELKNEWRTGLLFLGDEYKALEIERSGDEYFSVFLESHGSEAGDDERTETFAKKKINLNPKNAIFRLSFRKIDDRNASVILSFVLPDGTEERTQEFSVKNAHWVGGRFGFYAIGSKSSNSGALRITRISD